MERQNKDEDKILLFNGMVIWIHETGLRTKYLNKNEKSLSKYMTQKITTYGPPSSNTVSVSRSIIHGNILRILQTTTEENCRIYLMTCGDGKDTMLLGVIMDKSNHETLSPKGFIEHNIQIKKNSE